MASVTNKDILRMIDDRDRCSYYNRDSIREDNDKVTSFFVSRNYKSKHAPLLELQNRLEQGNYRLTSSDVDLLRKYNIFTKVNSKTESSSPTFRQLIEDEKEISERMAADELEVAKNCLHNFFISDMYISGKKFFDVENTSVPRTITDEEFLKVIDSLDGKFGFSYGEYDYEERYNAYKKIFTLDYIIQKLYDKYNDLDMVTRVFDTFLLGTKEMQRFNFGCFPKEGDIRYFAKLLEPRNMVVILSAHNCRNMREYISNKSTINKKGNYKVKTI